MSSQHKRKITIDLSLVIACSPPHDLSRVNAHPKPVGVSVNLKLDLDLSEDLSKTTDLSDKSTGLLDCPRAFYGGLWESRQEPK